MKTLYFDCFAGISGDMVLGALVDLGADKNLIKSVLATVPVEDYSIDWIPVNKRGIRALFANVKTGGGKHHRGLKDVLDILHDGSIPAGALRLSKDIFTRLAEAEARVHGTTVDKVHFHEVGAVDAIVDIVGAAVAIDSLGDIRCAASAVRVGYGTIPIAHGEYPVPAPGTAELLRDVPVFAGEYEGEWTTPTGAAILTTICGEFGQLPPMKVDRIGYGAGTRDHERLPNVLRVMIGKAGTTTAPEVLVLEAQIDDMSPEIFSHLHDRFAEIGALDWFVTPVQMKKNRPGNLLTVLARPEQREEIADLLFAETTTIGYRWYSAQREELERESVEVRTAYGPVRIKVARRRGKVINAAAEYEDCKKLAKEQGMALRAIQDAAMAAWNSITDK